jgi:transposase
MILDPDRHHAVVLIDEAVVSGAACYKACHELGISIRTYERWVRDGTVKSDGRSGALRPAPSNKLSAVDRQAIITIANSEKYGSLPPSQIVPSLADEGIYIASESTFYRVLHEHKL